MKPMELPNRKPTRLKKYDYSTPGAYFVTICTKDRRNLLCNIIVGEGLCALPQIIMTKIGIKVKSCIQFLNENLSEISIDNYVIMPNHIHLIVTIKDTGGDRTPPLHQIIGQLKSYTTNQFRENLWQRSFHDHIIRNEEDYRKITEYIDTNPLKWELDCFYNNERSQ